MGRAHRWPPDRLSRGPCPHLAPDWLRFARALQSIAQAGLTYAQDPFDRERYEQIRTVAAEIAAAGTDVPVEKIRGFFASERGYPTPKLDVRAAVIVEDRILLVQEHDDGGWTMPGGWADIGESAAESVVRETREEASAFFERDRLPPLSVARVTPEQIELAFIHHAHPDLPTAFD